jgi:hypothetical protein
MTTHLEEAIKQFDEWNVSTGHKKFGVEEIDNKSKDFAHYQINRDYKDEIKNFIINSHIKYLEGEIERLEKKSAEHILGFRGWVAVYLRFYNQAIQDQISHKQQELLQAKELLK